MRKNIVILAITGMLLASCSSQKVNLAYFSDIQARQGELPEQQVPKLLIQPDDELQITITSSNPEATALYNQPLANPATRGDLAASGTPKQQSYIVGRDGNITMPQLGAVYVKGKTTDEIAQTIKDLVSRDVKDPFVRVQLLNYNINVIGEVNHPTRISVNRQRYTVLDALSAAGDLTQYGRRDNVMVIREVDGQKHFQRLNLGTDSVFSSPYFYLQQNDVVYVEPNKIKVENSKFNQNENFKLSRVSTVVSMLSVIASLVIALTVK